MSYISLLEVYQKTMKTLKLLLLSIFISGCSTNAHYTLAPTEFVANQKIVPINVHYLQDGPITNSIFYELRRIAHEIRDSGVFSKVHVFENKSEFTIAFKKSWAKGASDSSDLVEIANAATLFLVPTTQEHTHKFEFFIFKNEKLIKRYEYENNVKFTGNMINAMSNEADNKAIRNILSHFYSDLTNDKIIPVTTAL